MFAPMAAAIVVGGLVAGPWVARVGPRRPMITGCALAAVGMALAWFELAAGTELSFGMLAVALALAGLGFGITVVPLTSAVLTQIPARHSGMAASATNTARQLGAVVGVAALGAIVNAHLTAEVDKVFGSPLLGGTRDNVLRILETGGSAGSFSMNDIPANFVDAFLDGLKVSLFVAIALIVAAGLASALVRDPAPIEDVELPAMAGEPRRWPPGGQSTGTGATSSGSAPPSTSSTGPA
jgi:MFS family permease